MFSYNCIISLEGGAKAGKITNSIIYMIAKDNLPCATVEKEGFQYLMRIVVPLYKIPGRKTITRLIEEKYTVLSTSIKAKLENVNNITLTADMWTDTLNTKSYLGVTGHYACGKNMNSVTIGVTELTERHTSDYLGSWLLNICNDWHINPDCVTAVVTDNGANMVKAVTDVFGNRKHLPCFAHSLNLVATQILEGNLEMEALCEKIKAIVVYFKRAISPADDLRKLECSKLIQSVPTRWNSTFYMIERFVSLSDKVSTILLKYPNSPMMLTAAELQLAKEILLVLGPLEVATREISGEHYVTASKIIPLINCINNSMKALDTKLVTDASIQLRAAVIKNLDKRFSQKEFVHTLAIATLLDPRFKTLHFNNKIACSQAIQKIAQKMKVKQITPELDVEKEQLEVQDNSDSINLWSYHNQLVNSVQSIQNEKQENDLPTDLKHFLNHPTVNLNGNPLLNWEETLKHMYPTLYPIAMQYLSVVATSVPSERLFSKAGNISVHDRNRLSSKHLQQLLFLNSLSLIDWNI